MSCSLRSPLNKFIGSQRAQTPQPAKVPYFGPQDDPWYDLTGKKPHSAKLPAVKKKQLMGLLERERSKERRERVSTMLTQRFVAKYGPKYEHIISFFVETYLSAQDDRSLKTEKQDLSALEKEIRNAIQQKNEEVQRAKEAAKQNQNKSAAEGNGSGENNSSTEAGGGEGPEYVRPPTSKEWELLQVYQIVKEEEKERLKEQARQAERLRVKNYLHEQMKNRNVGDQVETEADKRYAQNVLKDVEKYHAENEQKERARRKKYEDELKIRQAQIEAAKERLEKERSEQREMDQRNLSLAQQAAEKEAQKLRENKLREAERQKVIEAENARNKLEREKAKQREAEEDFVLMQKYAEKLDREAKEREEAFSKRMKEMEKYAMKFETEGAGKKEREERLKFETFLLKEQKKKEDSERERERQKVEAQKKRMEAALAENARQMERKRLQEQQEREEDLKIREQLTLDTSAFQEQQRREREKHRLAQEKYRTELEYQERDGKARGSSNVGGGGLSPAEREINAATFKDLQSDPKVMSMVMHRMRISSARGAPRDKK